MKIKLLILFAVNIVFFSCEKDSSPVVQEVKPGNITGVIDIYDSGDNSGAYVSIKGANYVTTTDYEGRWTLTNVEPGVYDIIFSKPGFDTTDVYGFQFAGNGTAYCDIKNYSDATELYNFNGMQWALIKTNDGSK
jgi:hypothetical protein